MLFNMTYPITVLFNMTYPITVLFNMTYPITVLFNMTGVSFTLHDLKLFVERFLPKILLELTFQNQCIFATYPK